MDIKKVIRFLQEKRKKEKRKFTSVKKIDNRQIERYARV